MKSSKHKIIISALSAVFYLAYSFLLRHQVSNVFTTDISNQNIRLLSVFLSCIFGYCVFFLIFTALYLFIQKNNCFLSYLKQFLLYFIPLFILLILTWPGIFKGDDFYVLNAIRDYSLSPAQTGLTSLFYICCIRFFPSMGSIAFFQIIIISCIYAYIFKNLKEIYPGHRFFIARAVFFLLPVLDGCLFTLRATLVGFLFLLILASCLFIWKRQTIHIRHMIILSVLTGLVIAWRSEFIYMLLFLPFYFFFLFYKKNSFRSCLKHAIFCFLIVLCAFLCFNLPNKIALNGSNKYPISLVINPLGNIFAQEEIRGEHAYDDIMTINELIDVQALRNHPSVRNISQYWNIPDILPKEQLNAFMKASFDLILNNFDHFLYYRWQTFKYTNGMVPDDINHPTAPTVETIYTLNYYGENYRDRYYYSNAPFGEPIRNKTIDILSCRHYETDHIKTNILYPIMYNCLPTFVIALLCMIICILAKKYAMAALLFLSGFQLVFIFLTAPAMFFMYYFCFYLTGYFLSALSVYELRLNKPLT